MKGRDALYYLINGLPIGAIYALLALGYSLIYASAGVLNWSQGDMVMLGAYIGYSLHRLAGLNYIVSALISMLAVACIGMLVERTVLNSLRKRSAPPINVVMVPWGQLSSVETLLLQYGAQMPNHSRRLPDQSLFK